MHEISSKIKQIVAEVAHIIDPDSIPENIDLRDCIGLDSLSLTEVMMKVEDEFHLTGLVENHFLETISIETLTELALQPA